MTDNHEDLRRKEQRAAHARVQARSNKKRQVKTVGTVLALIYEDERALYERWIATENKKEAFMQAMNAYYAALDKE